MRYARKILPVLHAKAIDGQNGMVEAYVSVFNNVDFMGEVIRPGFFAPTIEAATTQGKDLPAVLWSHDMWALPIGITTEAEEVLPYDTRLPRQIEKLGGLRVVGKFNMDVQSAKEAHSSIVFGSLRKYSISYYVIKELFNREEGTIELLEGDWLEWSPVNFAANDMTMTVDAKSDWRLAEKTEHTYIVRSEADFESDAFRCEQREADGKTYYVVTGKLRATGDTSEARLRFDADAWSADDARDVCTSKGGKGAFEAATKGAALEQPNSGGERLAEHGARVVAQLSAYLDRVEHVKSVRIAEGKAGRVLSEANRNILAGLLPDLQSVMDRVQGLLDATDNSSGSDGGKSDTDVELNADQKAQLRKIHARMLVAQAELIATE